MAGVELSIRKRMQISCFLISHLILFGLVTCKKGDKEDKIKAESVSVEISQNLEASPYATEPPSVYTRKYEESEFGEFYEAFFCAFSQKNDWSLDYFINSSVGLFVIDANGAIPQITKIRYIHQYRKLTDSTGILDYPGCIGKYPIFGELPKINCDLPERYTKVGAITDTINLLLQSRIEEVATLINTTRDEVKEAFSKIRATTVNTSNYTFYWGVIEGSWHIIAIDVRTPCEA